MPTDLNSRVFSTDTLVEGISLVKMETGMDPLRASDAAIAEELAKLQELKKQRLAEQLDETHRPVATPVRSDIAAFDDATLDMLQHVAMIGAPEEPPRNDYQDVSTDVGNDSMESLDHELCHDDPYDYGFFHQADEVGATADDCADMWQTLQAALNEDPAPCPPEREAPSPEQVAELRATPPKPKGSTPEPPSLKRLRRLLAPRADGTLLVPQEIVDQFGDLHGGGREQVLAMWNAADTCKESFIRRCRRKIESINEQDLYAEGEFLSEQDLIEQEYKETRINAIKAECAKRKGWIRRDRYEKHVKLYWVETKLGGKNLKRKRQVLEEEESMDEDDFKKAEDEFNQDLLPQEFDLPEDTTGDQDPTILVEADGEEDQRKALKVLAFPILDDDALPSSVNQKVLASIAKWRVKMHQLGAVIDQLDDAPDSYKELSKRSTELDVALKTQEELIMGINISGIVDGFKKEQQDDLVKHFKTSREECANALNLVTRAQPFVSSVKALLRKREKESKESTDNPETPVRTVKAEPRSSGRRR